MTPAAMPLATRVPRRGYVNRRAARRTEWRATATWIRWAGLLWRVVGYDRATDDLLLEGTHAPEGGGTPPDGPTGRPADRPTDRPASAASGPPA